MMSLQEMQSNGFADANRAREEAASRYHYFQCYIFSCLYMITDCLKQLRLLSYLQSICLNIRQPYFYCLYRISEKDDELRRLRSALDSERSKNESLGQELKSSKRDGNIALETMQADLANHMTEMKLLEQALAVEKRQHELTKEKVELTNSLLRTAEEKSADSAAVKQLLEQMRHENEGLKETTFRLQSELNTVTYQKTLAEKEAGKGVAEITTLTSRIRQLEVEVVEKDAIDHALADSQRRLQEANERLTEVRVSNAVRIQLFFFL